MAIQCPKCKSADVHAEKRGWSIFTGSIGSKKIYLTCLNCNHRFKPGEQARPEEPVQGLAPETKAVVQSLGRSVGRVLRYVKRNDTN
jgi:hypothetical protein